MNVLRTLSAFQATDGTIHLSERDALVVSVAALVKSPVGDVEEHILKNLDDLFPILQRLTDPRFRLKPVPEAPEAPAAQPAISAVGPSVADLDAIGETRQPVPGEYDAEQGAAPILPEIDPADLRVGQLIVLRIDGASEMEGTIASLSNSNEFPIMAVVDKNGDMPIKHSEVIRVLKQPEQLLDLATAKAELEPLAGKLLAELSPLDRTRRILLSSRIGELERADEQPK